MLLAVLGIAAVVGLARPSVRADETALRVVMNIERRVLDPQITTQMCLDNYRRSLSRKR